MYNRGLLSTWELWRKVVLGLCAALMVFTVVVASLPLGFAALGAMVLAAHVWKDLAVTDPTLGSYIPGTFAYRVALFFTATRSQYRQVLSPLWLAFGPPTDDPDHDLAPGFFPFARLSSYWVALVAAGAGAVEVALVSAHFPFWGGQALPWALMWPLSSIGFFAAGQLFTGIRRLQGDANTMIAMEPAPAAMISPRAPAVPWKELGIRAGAFGAAPALLVVLIWAVGGWPWKIAAIVAPGVLLLVAAIIASRSITAAYRTGWAERAARREEWAANFSFLKDKAPVMINEMELPTLAEYQQNLDAGGGAMAMEEEGEEVEPYEPLVKIAAFQFAPNATFEDYQGLEKRIQGYLGVESCAIAPIGISDAMGAEQPGTVGSRAFRVWWPVVPETPALMAREMHPWMREYVVRAALIPALASIKAIGPCTFVNVRMVTKANSETTVIKASVVPFSSGVTVESFLSNLDEIRRVLAVGWVRVGRERSRRGSANAISVYFGDVPSPGRTQFVNPAVQERKTIDAMDWAYYFNAQKISGTTGVPALVERRPATAVVDKLVFALPDGLPFEVVANKMSSLKTTSGNAFMEIELGDEKLEKMSPEERIRNESAQAARFTIIAAREDPLKRVFAFGDYRDKLFTGREDGVAKVDWSPGILADDQPAWDSWTSSDNPHLLVAGQSGSGKLSNVCSIIQTTVGPKALGEITEGDIVFDVDGKPSAVLHAFEPVRPPKGYRVTFSNRTSVVVSGDHLWSFADVVERRRVSSAKWLSSQLAARTPDLLAKIGHLEQVHNALMIDDLVDSPPPGPAPSCAHPGAIGATAGPLAHVQRDHTWTDAHWWSRAVESAGAAHQDVDLSVTVPAHLADKNAATMAGVMLALGQLGNGEPGRLVHLTTADPTLARDVLALGYGLRLTRTSGGRARYAVRGAFPGTLVRTVMTAAAAGSLGKHGDARDVLAGIARAVGRRDGSTAVFSLPSERLSLAGATALTQASGWEHRVWESNGHVVVSVRAPLEVARDCFEAITTEARSLRLYDDRGRRVLDPASIAALIGCSRIVVDRLVEQNAIAPAAHWHSPTIQRVDTGALVKASRATWLYPAADVVRHLLNEVQLSLRDDHDDTLRLSTFTTEEIAADFDQGPFGERKYCVPFTALDFPDTGEELAVGPYTLGAWLGDGSSANGSVCGVDAGIFKAIESEGYEPSSTRWGHSNGNPDYRIATYPRLRAELRSIGLLGRGLKRIPEVYQRAPFAVRLALLQGLMDTDGYTADPEKGSTGSGISLSKPDLASDVVRLVRGLGINATVRTKETSYTHQGERKRGQDSTVISFTTALAVHRLARKAERLPRPEQVDTRVGRLYVTDVVELAAQEIPMMRCITVDSLTHTYRIGEGLVPTHNSVVMSSFLLQVAYNNAPSEAVLWLVEPKTEMQVYRDIDVVERFVDSWSPDENFIPNVADMMEDAVKAMNVRNKAFITHPKQPKNLYKAREIAVTESTRNGTPLSDHPLYMPFMFIVLEECASLFAESASKEEKAEQARLVVATAEIARKARSAGIYLICATQYPTNASIPSVIRQQMRRIGMRCGNDLASQVVIGESGLQDIRTKGVGKIMTRDQFRHFRGYWVQDGDPDHNQPNDILSTVQVLPGGGGGVAGQVPLGVSVVSVPVPGASAFALWDQSLTARGLRSAIDTGKKTRDKTDADVPTNAANPTLV